MMCFGAHGHGSAGANIQGDVHVGSSVPHSGVERWKHHSAKKDMPHVSFKDDNVACSLFTVTVWIITCVSGVKLNYDFNGLFQMNLD